MISRRNIRVKVMQSLYVLDSISGDLKPGQAINLLKKQIDQSRQLFIYLIYFIIEVARYAEKDAIKKASKHLPSQSDLNINTKIVGNELIWKIVELPSYMSAVAEVKPQLIADDELLRKTYLQLIESEEYKDYIEVNSRDKKSEKDREW